MEVLEHHETIEHAGHGGHAHGAPPNKKIALLIAALAALLAITEAAGKSAQTATLSDNVQASDLWSFYQAKTIRSTILRATSELVGVVDTGNLPPDRQAALQKQISRWRSDISHYDSDPASGEGRKELMARARIIEENRDTAAGAYHLYEYAGAALQLAIVLASASVITDLGVMAAVALGLGGVGLVLDCLAWWAPMIMHGAAHG